MEKCLGKAVIKEKLGIPLCQRWQFPGQRLTVRGSQDFRALLSDLRSIDAHPDAIRFGTRAPEIHVLFEVARTLHHRARDYPVDVDLAAFDIFEDAFVGRRL